MGISGCGAGVVGAKQTSKG